MWVPTGFGVAACVIASGGICGGAIATISVSGGIGAAGGSAAYIAKNAGSSEFIWKYAGVSAGLAGAGSIAFSGTGYLGHQLFSPPQLIKPPVRIGPTSGGINRVSIGQSPYHFNKYSPIAKVFHPLHLHIEKNRMFINIYGKPLSKILEYLRFW